MGERGIEKLLKRYETFAPLLNENLDAFERRRLRAQILESSGLSERQLRRHIQRYKEEGWRSLEDAPRSDKGRLREISDAVVDEAVKLRQELPTRSVRRIILFLLTLNSREVTKINDRLQNERKAVILRRQPFCSTKNTGVDACVDDGVNAIVRICNN